MYKKSTHAYYVVQNVIRFIGENTKLSQYKTMLEKKDVKKLYKMAKEMGINITKKKYGKTSYIKKETIVKKICDVYKICNKNSKSAI